MGKLNKDIQESILKSFNSRISRTSLANEPLILEKFNRAIENTLINNYSEKIKNGLKLGLRIVTIIKETNDYSIKKIGLAAIEYFLDPWDIIPDIIGEDGLLDDIFVFQTAISFIEDIDYHPIEKRTNNSSSEQNVS